ncbi:hypothetical protein EYM_05160 [Ignicoccus islandicus DSM 13165]|uniref:Uncharacterized protein n=1 Tax=Ignicoccus islandicus DSM 13165 TaxID=940295 RepID=A0A0U2WNM0_9CREN|nr:hypothetical protein EYM_05160 [Ignicoccus islandicus DSM 13165]
MIKVEGMRELIVSKWKNEFGQEAEMKIHHGMVNRVFTIQW